MSINWTELWKLHSPYFKNGKFILELENKKQIEFHPGPAFGDGSHPTTNLMLSHIKKYVKDNVVVDLGSGTGILSLASIKYGAKSVFAFEIDNDSIENMKINFKMNSIKDVYINEIPSNFDIVLINMISSEQNIALKSHPYLVKPGITYIISGILKNEHNKVLKQLNTPKLLYSTEQGPWSLLIAKS